MQPSLRVVVAVALLAAAGRSLPAAAAAAGDLAPSFSATDLAGKPVSSADQVGARRLLLLFWDWRRATSARAMQACDRLQQTYGRQGLEVVAIEGQGSAPEDVRERVEKLRSIGIAQRYTVVPDPGGKIAREFGVEGTPQLFVIGHDGRVALHVEGFRVDDEARLEAAVKEALGLEQPPAARAAVPVAAEPATAAAAAQDEPAGQVEQPAEDPAQAQREKYRYFANFHFSKGELVKAEDLLRKYLELAPADVAVWLQLGEVCARQRRYDQAREAWEKVLQLSPGNAEADANIRRLIRGEY